MKYSHTINIVLLIIVLIISIITINLNSNLESAKLEKTELDNKYEEIQNLKEELLEKINLLKLKEDEIRFLENQLLLKDNQKEVNYMYGTSTAYHPPSRGINSDHDPTVTSIGLEAKEGIIAVNPNMIPYGSEVMIIHENIVIRGIAGDTGGAMMRNPSQVDILMDDLGRAIEWGRRKVHILWW